jgi:transposase InsO family protein
VPGDREVHDPATVMGEQHEHEQHAASECRHREKIHRHQLNVTAHPTAAWTAQQLREAWPWDTAPRFIIRDRDAIYGSEPQRTLQHMGIQEVLTAPRCPWQNPFVARVIGSLRRECLDHVIVWNERSLRRHLQHYVAYYHEWRTHLSLDKDAPVPRAAQPPACGTIVSFPHVGGLHHHYERRAA